MQHARIILQPPKSHLPRGKPATSSGQQWSVEMKTMMLAAITALSLGVAAANAQAAVYHAPSNNYQQNNWLQGGD